MEKFINLDFDIKEIILTLNIPSGKGDAVHQNRPSHGLAFHLAGDKRYDFLDGASFNVKGGEIIFLPKGSSYVVKALKPGECFAVNFNFFEDKSLSPFVFLPKNLMGITEHFKTATKLWNAKLPGYISGCKGELYGILHLMQNEYNMKYVSDAKFELIAPAVKFIHSNYTNETLQVDALSKMCGITPEYFRSIFKSRYGVSPIKYINDLKLARAKELISSGMYSIKEAAVLSGFSDPAHFSRVFRKNVGLCPSKFKEKN